MNRDALADGHALNECDEAWKPWDCMWNHRVDPGESQPELPYFDEDWFRMYHRPDDRAAVVVFEVHELGCTRSRCQYRNEPCSFHPDDCDCSEGACQT